MVGKGFFLLDSYISAFNPGPNYVQNRPAAIVPCVLKGTYTLSDVQCRRELIEKSNFNFIKCAFGYSIK